MHRHHQRTLQALFAHPLSHGLRLAEVEALLVALGAEVSRIDGERLRVQLPDGHDSWLRCGGGGGAVLDPEAVLRLRHLLQQADIGPDHAAAASPAPRGDQSRRLVLHLDHHHTDVFHLEGDAVDHAVMRPHGLWGSGETLTHRHDRDLAGQRAPLDSDYLARITDAIGDAEVVLLLGHGHGESDMRQLLMRHLSHHRPDLLQRIVAVVTLDDGGLSEAGLVAIAREHFGNLPQRHPMRAPGQETPWGA
jgi:hypothetical protein